MDKATAYAINDLLDAVDEIVSHVSDINPGTNTGMIDFLLRRVRIAVEPKLKKIEKRKGRAVKKGKRK